MCTSCGCGDPDVVPVEVHERILAGNDRQARHNREHFVESGVLALNLMGSPGSGKTALLEATARALRGRLRLGAVSADLATDYDARRLEAAGIPSKSITTGQACHLDAELVHRALHDLPWRETDIFFIENVGNLVCPAIYDLGQAANVVALSITEGEDKPLKYPVMFKTADLVVLTKCDLVPHLDVSLERIADALARVMPDPALLRVSARTGEGIDGFVAWLEGRRATMTTRDPSRGARMHSHEHPHADEHRHDATVHGHVHTHSHAHEHEHDHAPGKEGEHRHEGDAGHAHRESGHLHPHHK